MHRSAFLPHFEHRKKHFKRPLLEDGTLGVAVVVITVGGADTIGAAVADAELLVFCGRSSGVDGSCVWHEKEQRIRVSDHGCWTLDGRSSAGFGGAACLGARLEKLLLRRRVLE
jgi:hypothetical protein